MRGLGCLDYLIHLASCLMTSSMTSLPCDRLTVFVLVHTNCEQQGFTYFVCKHGTCGCSLTTGHTKLIQT